MENPPFEGAFPYWKRWISIARLVYWRGNPWNILMESVWFEFFADCTMVHHHFSPPFIGEDVFFFFPSILSKSKLCFSLFRDLSRKPCCIHRGWPPKRKSSVSRSLCSHKKYNIHGLRGVKRLKTGRFAFRKTGIRFNIWGEVTQLISTHCHGKIHTFNFRGLLPIFGGPA